MLHFIPFSLRQWCVAIALVILPIGAQASKGAAVPWITYEAEDMTNNGTVLGPQYGPNVVASESSGRKCVRLNATGQFVQFTAQAAANAMVVRYSVPDSADGVGTDSTISLYKNGGFVGKLPVTSKYSWLYGSYPFSNTPANGTPRNFYDEVRTNGLSINPGDIVRLQKDADDTAAYYIIDLVDLENVDAPLTAPADSLSILSHGAGGAGVTDDTAALVNCISAAYSQGKSVWLPAGTYKITSTIHLPANTRIQGAGIWHTTLVGDAALYGNASRRVTLNGFGGNIRLSDFAITGKLNYRNDSEPNDALGGSFGTGSTISRIWVEHTKVGGWIVNSHGLVVEGCRFRNVIADGINLSVGMRNSIVTNCTARGTGDDCFAIWPATYISQTYAPGFNVITHCTGQLPFLANGGAIYGGEANRIEDCLFEDISYGCGILISTTFPVGNNNFSGTTVAQRCDLNRCGGYDHGFQWRAAVQLCLEGKSLSGINLNNLNITNSVSDGLSIIAPGSNVGSGVGTLSFAIVSGITIPNYGIGTGGRHGLWARNDTIGSMTVSNSAIVEHLDSSPNFAFNFVTTPVSVTVQTSPSGRAFTVDGTNYTTPQTFNWMAASSHVIATTSPQPDEVGVRYLWNSWSDGGLISHTVSPTADTIYTANFSTQYYLTSDASAGGDVSPASDWYDSGTGVQISATASNGYSFSHWNGSGGGSYSGGDNPASVTMSGPITQTAEFTLIPARIISLGGDLAFGNVPVGTASNRTLTIGNNGNAQLTVSGINYPDGFSGSWSGAVPAAGFTNVTVSFSPNGDSNYSGNLTVHSDATSGVNSKPLSGAGIAPPITPPQNIHAVVVNEDGSLTLTYATSPGFSYHVESATNLTPAVWVTVAGSQTNAAGNTVTFTDTNPPAIEQRYYRTVSP